MVSFKPQGRLGNFLFIAATMIAYAKKHGIEFSMPGVTNNQFWNPLCFPHLINPKWREGGDGTIVHEQTLFKHDELPFQESWRDRQILLNGYFQNPKYFEEYREEILRVLNFPWELKEGTVSIHVRRGDYLTLTEKHPPVPIRWIYDAMGFFESEKRAYNFVFFSDDIAWCKEKFGYRFDCSFVEGGDELSDLIKLSQCEHHINSASTFSWWGAWLNQNQNKKVIVPKQWHTPSHSNEWTEEIIPKDWIRI